MKYCETCGFQTKDRLRKCPRCGTDLTDTSLREGSPRESFYEDDEATVYARENTPPPSIRVSLAKEQGFSDNSGERVSLEKTPRVQNTTPSAFDDEFTEPVPRESLNVEKRSSLRKAIVTAAEVAAIIALLVGAFVLYKQISPPEPDMDRDTESITESEPEESIASLSETGGLAEVPDVVGFSRETAEEILGKAEFGCKVSEQETDEYQENTVIDQIPSKGEKVPKNTEVSVVVAVKPSGSQAASSGAVSSKNEESSALTASKAEQVSVPDVRGMKFEDAEKQLKARSLLAAASSYEYSDTVPENCVISQSPSGGKAAKNTKVALVISRGQDPANIVKLGNYVGMDILDVIGILESNGIAVNYTYEDNSYYSHNSIIRQDKGSGTTLKRGSTVNFVVSNGPQTPTREPESKPQSRPSVVTIPETYSKPVFNGVSASSVRASEGSYTYSASNALHNDSSCWCEGASGDGVGEYIILTADKPQTVAGCQLTNGYARDSTVFKNNGRLTSVVFEFSDGSVLSCDLDPDDMGVQVITFPEPVETTSMKVTIGGVKSGDKYKDTCISLIVPF